MTMGMGVPQKRLYKKTLPQARKTPKAKNGMRARKTFFISCHGVSVHMMKPHLNEKGAFKLQNHISP